MLKPNGSEWSLPVRLVKTYTRLVPFVVDKISIQDDIVKLPLAEISPNELPKAREIACQIWSA